MAKRRRALTRKQIAAGFGGKTKRRARSTTVARKKRSSGRRRSFGRSGGMNSEVDGLIGGAGAVLGAKYLGSQWGPAAGMYAAGKWRRNETLKTLAGVSLGAQLGGQFAGALPGGSGTIGAGGLL